MTDSSTTKAPTRLGVDIWLDVACPWCIVGERRFEKVLDALPFKDDVDVRYHSFQLDPNAPERSSMKQPEYLASRGMDPARFADSLKHLEQMGAPLGIAFDQANAIPSNTFTAHRLIQAAGPAGVQQAVTDALFSAYFEKGLDVGDPEVLRSVAGGAGLPSDVVEQVLADPTAYRAEVDGDIRQASEFGITGVPFYVFDGRYGVSGAQPEEVFGQAMEQVYQELNPPQKLQTLGGLPGAGGGAATAGASADGEVCGPDGCTV